MYSVDLGCDINGHNYMYSVNRIGEVLVDLILSNNLKMGNAASQSTWPVPSRFDQNNHTYFNFN